MATHTDAALSLAINPSLPLGDAVHAVQTAAATSAFARAQALLSPSPAAESELEAWNLALQLLAFRIEHAAGVDPLGAVIGLRRWGVTWDVIGRAAGITRQAAHNRWGAPVRATLDRYGTGDLGGPVADDEGDLNP